MDTVAATSTASVVLYKPEIGRENMKRPFLLASVALVALAATSLFAPVTASSYSSSAGKPLASEGWNDLALKAPGYIPTRYVPTEIGLSNTSTIESSSKASAELGLVNNRLPAVFLTSSAGSQQQNLVIVKPDAVLSGDPVNQSSWRSRLAFVSSTPTDIEPGGRYKQQMNKRAGGTIAGGVSLATTTGS